MSLADIKDLIASVGFPIFVAVYFLVVTSKALKSLTVAVNSLKETVKELCSKLGHGVTLQ